MLDELESKQRYNDYLREVKQEQLYRQVTAHQPAWYRLARYQKALIRLGDILITVGYYLKAKSGSQTELQPARTKL